MVISPMTQSAGNSRLASAKSDGAKSDGVRHVTDAAKVVATPLAAWLGLGALLLVFLSLCIGSASQKSVTVDELGHLPSGLYSLLSGDPRHAALNPPLLNALSSLPVLALDLESALEPVAASDDVFSFWSTGYQFLERHRADYRRIFAAARVVPILLVAALGLLLFFWAQQLAPRTPWQAGLLAASLVWFSPGVIANARLVATDTGTAVFLTLAVYCFRAMLLRPSVTNVARFGVLLGLAQLTKFYALLLYPALLVVLLAWHALSEPPRSNRTRLLGCYAVATALSVVVLNAGYFFAEFGTSLSQLALHSSVLQSLQHGVLGAVPIPLPGAFVRAIDGQFVEVASGLRSFLVGESFQGGRWDYYLIVLAIKTPLIFFVSFGAAAYALFFRAPLARREVVLLLTFPVLLFLLLSLGGNRQLGGRALLAAVPLVQLWVAVSWVSLWGEKWRNLATGAVIAGAVLVCVATYPDYLSYFNPLVGGNEQGYRNASDANVDIGQDLVALSRYLDEQGVTTVQLYYFGSVDPAVYGIDYVVPSDYQIGPEMLAISVSLYHMSYEVYDHGVLRRVGPVDVSSLGEPVASIGDSIHVYRRE